MINRLSLQSVSNDFLERYTRETTAVHFRPIPDKHLQINLAQTIFFESLQMFISYLKQKYR